MFCWQRDLSGFRDLNGGRCLFYPPAFPENLVMLWDFPSPQRNSLLGGRQRLEWQCGYLFESSRGRGLCLQCILLLHPCTTWVLSSHSLGTSLGHSVLSIFPFLACWQQTDHTWREEVQQYSECLWNRELMQWPQYPGYQTPKGAHEVGASGQQHPWVPRWGSIIATALPVALPCSSAYSWSALRKGLLYISCVNLSVSHVWNVLTSIRSASGCRVHHFSCRM